MLKILLLFCVCWAALAQGPIRLIVRADDMGYTHSGNQAIVATYKNGIASCVEVIVNSPWFPEAARLLRENADVDVGVHLALTSEWENVKWRPLSDAPSLRDANGYFFPMVNPNKNYPGQAIKENAWKMEDIEKEFRAQIQAGLKAIPRISHVSSHMGCTMLSEQVRQLTRRLAREYKIDIEPREYQVIGIGYSGPSKTPEQKIASFLKMLDKLEPGKTYLFVDHPGLDNDELRAVYHIGYENVAADRQGVTNLFTSDKVKAAMQEKRILRIGYRDLLR
jgi:predicted glycoside hydrolase/deacetylase ChbG (UPF0249 family)